jgi:hypothetical protein
VSGERKEWGVVAVVEKGRRSIYVCIHNTALFLRNGIPTEKREEGLTLSLPLAARLSL